MDAKSVEEKLTSEKNWNLKGEIKASNRPANSLVNAELDFETRLINVPISKDENAQIFKYITQRFKEKTFDNYEFKEIKPKIEEEKYDLELIESNKEIIELYDKIESEIRKMMDYGTS